MVTIKKMAETSFHIKEPGLNILPPGVERYVVNGGGITGIQILPDDEIEIINNEGNQICEISVFNKNGMSETGILNLKENKDTSELKKILSSKDENSKIAAYQLKKRNLEITKAKASIVFDKDTNSVFFPKIKVDFNKVPQLMLVACGTAYHSCMVA